MIYFFDNYEQNSLENLTEFLPEKRREKCLRLRQKRDRENCIAVYFILKQILKEKGIDFSDFDTDENGKPFIKNCPLYFNISHCRLGAVVAVSESPVGVDVQNIGDYNKKVAERVCTEEELLLINNSPDKAKAFTRLWTLKEAAAKYDGKGIQILKNFSFENGEKFFEKYGRKFTAFEKKNLFISVCGDEKFSDIIEIKNLEVF